LLLRELRELLRGLLAAGASGLCGSSYDPLAPGMILWANFKSNIMSAMLSATFISKEDLRGAEREFVLKYFGWQKVEDVRQEFTFLHLSSHDLCQG
jgi:hypothetical protein